MEVHIYFTILLSGIIVTSSSQAEVSLNDDPSLFPGHMEPLGAKQPRVEIEVLSGYPSPQGELYIVLC